MNRLSHLYISIPLVLALLLAALPADASDRTATEKLMKELEGVIEARDRYALDKEERIAGIRSQMDTAKSDRTRFEILDRLYGEYHSFLADSAYDVSARQAELALTIGDNVLMTRALLNRANIFDLTGQYHETLELIDTVRTHMMPDYLKPYYYHIRRTVYGHMADYTAVGPDRDRYLRLTNTYRDSILSVNAPNTLPYAITLADSLNVSGQPQRARETLESFMTTNNLSEHDRAICAWTLAEAYNLLDMQEQRKEWLLISSISDLKSAVREYVSLRELAMQLYAEGDLENAYRYLSIAVDDAARCNARQRIVELSALYPLINRIYIEKVRNQKRALMRTVAIITILLVTVALLALYMRRQMGRIARARLEIQQAYEQLNEVTRQLKASNERLSEANHDIAENSELKEVYIGRYMDQCLGYIGKLDAFRRQIGKQLAARQEAEVMKAVKSSAMIDEEFKAFYEQFDQTFLSLFPDFVEDMNRLLLPEEAIVPRKPGTLTSELRVYALIRLGITDSNRIAKFLRYSVTTIYNYRTKVRNKARGDRNTLEEEVLRIGRTARRQTFCETVTA